MKNSSKAGAASCLFIAVILCISFSSCYRDNSALGSSTQDKLVRNPWSISLFSGNGVNFTSQFSGDVLLFSETGAVALKQSATVTPGSWNRQVLTGERQTYTLHFESADPAIHMLSSAWELVHEDGNSMEFSQQQAGGSASLVITRQ